MRDDINGKHTVKITRLPGEPEKIADLINQLVKGHCPHGDLCKKFKKVMTPEHTLGKLFEITKNRLSKIGLKDMIVKVYKNQPITSPLAEEEKIEVLITEQPEKAPTQTEIDQLKADIKTCYNAYIELARRGKLSQSLLSMHPQLCKNSALTVQTKNPVLALTKENMLLGDYATLKLNLQTITDCRDIHNQRFHDNMERLPTTQTTELPLLAKVALQKCPETADHYTKRRRTDSGKPIISSIPVLQKWE